MMTNQSKIVGILGGGVTGLATAFYIRKKFGDLVRPIILEKTSSCGGWIKSIEYQTSNGDPIYFESGPRTFRPVGLTGINALELAEDLGFEKEIQYIDKQHSSLSNKFLFLKGQLVKLPLPSSMIFNAVPPFKRPLYRAFLNDLTTMKFKTSDDSVYNFAKRRFGDEVADYLIDPLIRGIYAGDSRKISVTSTALQKGFHFEQRFGSVTLGLLASKFKEIRSPQDVFADLPNSAGIGLSVIGRNCIENRWELWGLEGGTETLTKKLTSVITKDDPGAIVTNAVVKSISFPRLCSSEAEQVTIKYKHSTGEEKTLICDYVTCALPAWELVNIFRNSDHELQPLIGLLEHMKGANLTVTNVLYENDTNVIPPEKNGFGFLVPSYEANNTPEIKGLLGIVFDSNTFSQGDHTILTVMAEGPKSSSEFNGEDVKAQTMKYLRRTLGITRPPCHMNVSYAAQCIPQYEVGHWDTMTKARTFLKDSSLPLTLSGASFEGVSVNDCIYSARRATESLPFAFWENEATTKNYVRI